ncbi:sulfite exporter TauE/SafE family protein [Microaerobacter geothermalis]|uniref:cytochrome c biogenesis CcdA family protein n=1 Tax=Microaerobacter geothermalis TaxID=674972 RepID=UPI001F3EFF4F|nr:cytochrome c biogenesis protein CcdA [Microaerobacter geothermalis]MCF6092523.1 sulfite exporter TauE/SafE family protein [Microaerobacter geothermalis]
MEWIHLLSENLAAYSMLTALVLSFAVGVLTSFNPCMLGMASSISAFSRKEHGSLLGISLLFMMSFSLTLSFLGAVAALFGDTIIQYQKENTSLLYRLIAILFLGLSLYIFGLRLHHISRYSPITFVSFYVRPEKKRQASRYKQAAYFKVLSLGSLFGLTPSPCTTPMIIAILGYISITGSLWLGTAVLFAYGLGHSLPFLLAGWFTGTLHKKPWMVRWNRRFNHAIGIMLLLFAVYFIFLSFGDLSSH